MPNTAGSGTHLKFLLVGFLFGVLVTAILSAVLFLIPAWQASQRAAWTPPGAPPTAGDDSPAPAKARQRRQTDHSPWDLEAQHPKPTLPKSTSGPHPSQLEAQSEAEGERSETNPRPPANTPPDPAPVPKSTAGSTRSADQDTTSRTQMTGNQRSTAGTKPQSIPNAGTGSKTPTGPKPSAAKKLTAPREGQLTVPLEARPGTSPLGSRYKPGFPYPLASTAPPEVQKPPPGEGLLFGRIPLVHAPLDFAVLPPDGPSGSARFFLDDNRDGDLTNDGEGFAGTGTYRSGLHGKLTVRQADGGTFPYHVWIWTSHNHPASQPGQAAFNYYGNTVRSGVIQIEIEGNLRNLSVVAGDPGHTGAFDSGKIHLDWNGNGKAEDPELLAPGAGCRYQDRGVWLTEIAPQAAAATLEFFPSGHLPSAPDVAALLRAEPLPGNAPPELGLDLQDQPVRWEDYQGKVVLVDFWATWCGPCLRELPNVKAAYEKHHAAGLAIVGVSLDTRIETLQAFLQREALPWRQLCDRKGWESDLAKRWRVKSIPATFLIGRNGQITESGLSGPALLTAIERELARK